MEVDGTFVVFDRSNRREFFLFVCVYVCYFERSLVLGEVYHHQSSIIISSMITQSIHTINNNN